MASISIIILACNDEKWISTAVDSARQQTLRDIEIIVVDDGSADSTPAILADFAERDERVHIVTNERNRGMFYSRWNGVRHASGDYIMFLDSDDTLLPDACEVVSGELEKKDCDVFMFGSECIPCNDTVREQEIRETNEFLRPPVGPFPTGQGGMLEYVAGLKMSFNVWNKIFRRSVLVKAFANYDGQRIQMAEDLLLTAMAFAYSCSFGTTMQILYRYTYGSGVSTVFRIDRKKIESYAAEAQVFQLLNQWMPVTGLEEDVSRDVLKMARELTSNDVLTAFFFRTDREDCAYYIEQVLQYWTAEELSEALTEYVFRQKKVNTPDAWERLQDCFTVLDGREKVVGLFCSGSNHGISDSDEADRAETERIQSELVRLDHEIAALVESNRYFENTIHEIQSSTSFRLGMFLTWPLRRLKDWIRGLRK